MNIEKINEYELLLQDKKEKTRDIYVSRIQYFLNWCDEKKLEVNQISLLKYLKGRTDSVRNQIISAIKIYLSLIGKETDLLKTTTVVNKKRGHFTKDQLERLLATRLYPKKPHIDVRNILIIRLMVKSGLRISEVLGLKAGDIGLDSKVIDIRGLHVKRNVSRVSFIDDETFKLLVLYLKKFNFKKKEKLFDLNSSNFRRIFKRYTKEAGGIPEEFSPHTLRHTFSITYINKGGKLPLLSKMLGHNSVDTTSIYLDYSDSELKEAFNKIIN